MREKVLYCLALTIGAALGFVFVDVGHFLFNRFYIHNMYVVYFLVGAMVALIMRPLIKVIGDA